MSAIILEKTFRIFSGVALVVWGILHLFLAESLLRLLPIVGQFFIADSLLAFVGSVVLLLGLRIFYLPTFVFALINYLLLTESRVYPAPVLGRPLPAVNSLVILTFALDVVMIVLLTGLLVSEK